MVPMLVIRCEGCGRRVGIVRDTRFGLVPTSTTCPACSVAAAFRATSWN